MIGMNDLALVGFGMPGVQEMIIILAIFLLLFGSTKLPGLMRSMGQSVNEFKRGMNDTTDDSADQENGEAPKRNMP
ncbi:Sec-independent protein translocase subunit TatA/TatB [Bremerella sp. P1]|uniref:Sec-independent protein translocase subunit TatA/TatB n=1 Tax=Bremerella sp. P1 TaxID=3026424 RepID=UPI0023687622|nr:twin-arginine translocase TatA/TatE family subunit [Bremerella sp. P1]WDI42315.1 twin-arginine translocase TatA/TatE family subunit [Bremerella sp. P1]